MAEDEQPLEQSILKQVEYYFSPQNLQSDHYLVSKMNPQMYVPLEVVAGFKMLRNLTTDIELIKSALRGSTKVQLTEGPGDQCLIRPTLSSAARVTIILRDIPKDVPEEEIRKIFVGHKIQQVRPDIGDTWFLSFATEDECLAAYDQCQLETFRGTPIKARIKSENLLKNFLPTQAPEAQQQPSVFMPPHPGFGFGPTAVPMPYPYMMPPNFSRPPMMGPNTDPYGVPGMLGPQSQPIGMMAVPGLPPDMAGKGQANAKGGKGAGKAGYFGGRGRGGVPGVAGGKGGKDGTEGRGAQKRGSQNGQKLQNPPKLSQSDFPPLPSSSPQSGGYTGTFKRYQKEEIISILSGLAKQTQGGSSPPALPICACVAEEPINTLELCRNTDEVVGTTARPKSFAEAALSAEDIKKPEKPLRKNSKKTGDGSQEPTRGSRGRGGGSRNSRNSRNTQPKDSSGAGGGAAPEAAVSQD